MSKPCFFTPPIPSAQANPEAVFSYPQVRFCLLTERLLRIEISPNGIFEDRPSQAFWYRRQPLPPVAINYKPQGLLIDGEIFQLHYAASSSRFNPVALQITLKESGANIHLDQPNPHILPGTARTLDESSGPVRLQGGLLSRTGWVQIDDTPSLVFNPDGWLEARPPQRGYRDLYLLLSGSDYKAALADYQRVGGGAPLLPRPFLGNWWSRYWKYSQAEIEALVERFRKEDLPLSVFIIDMDWHITQTGNTCTGWTGFTWNRELFPDPPGLLAHLHRQGLLCALNLHPAEGIHPHEERYPQAARALALDPQGKKPIPFEIADPAFARVYFDELLHPLEAEGVDFWWIDWQQGETTRLPGLDPLWWLNHLHFYDLARSPDKRPVVFSRWGGPGNQRYPIGFSGDTLVTWQSLAYQPYFTASAANTAYGWWSHDIGGHMHGMEDSQLYTRWLQFGALSPILRLHCSNDPFINRAPWAFDAETQRLARQALHLRQSLVPYLYSMARRYESEGLPPLTPLYYDWTGEDSAYLAANQYLFGSQLLAAPVTSPLDPDLNLSRQAVWFPPGEWFDFFNGERFGGSQWRILYSSLDEIPLFGRAGAIVPLQTETGQNGAANPESLDLLIFPGQDGAFTLYEDDGLTPVYRQSGGCTRTFSSTWTENRLTLHVSPASADLEAVPRRRKLRFILRGVKRPQTCRLELDGTSLDLPFSYDEDRRSVLAGPLEIESGQEMTFECSHPGGLLAPPPTPRAGLLRLLRQARMPTPVKWKLSTQIDSLCADMGCLAELDLPLSHSQMRALLEIAGGAGAATFEHPQYGRRIVLLNPAQDPGFHCRREKTLQIEPGGLVLPATPRRVVVDYFGLLREKL